MQIVKETQHGAGGQWVVDANKNVGPLNLLRIVYAPSSAQRGVGGYTTRIRIGNKVLSWGAQIESLDDARRALAVLNAPEDEYSTWQSL